jgi:lysophospholipase L1-like esterase
MAEGEETPPAREAGTEGNRFLRAVTLGEILRVSGLALLVLAVFALSPGGQRWLVASDGATLDTRLAAFLERVQLVLGAVGLVLAGLGHWSRLGGRVVARAGDLALFTAAALLAFAGAEAWNRVQGARRWGSALRTPPNLDVIRSEGAALRPGVFADWVGSDFDRSYSKTAYFTVNRYGLRGRSPERVEREQRARVVCLGGSTTFGIFVTDGEEWPARLEARLSGRAEVLNAGRPGATSSVNYEYLRDRLLRFEPDVVVLYEGFNDLWKGVRRHAGEQPDYGRVDETMPPILEPLDRGSPAAWPLRPSFLVFRTGWWLRNRVAPVAPTWREPPPVAGDFRFEPAIVATFEHNLAAQIRLCRRHGAVPVVATIAGCDDPSAAPDEQALRLLYVLLRIPQLDARSAQIGLDLYREVARRVAQEQGVRLVDLARTMPKDLALFTDTVHFSPAGEDLLAQQMAEALRGELDGYEARRAAPPSD